MRVEITGREGFSFLRIAVDVRQQGHGGGCMLPVILALGFRQPEKLP